MGSKRIEYLDAMRGFAMLLVVCGHVMLFSFKSPNSLYGGINCLIELPLFFMISGYFCDKTQTSLTLRQAVHSLCGKVTALLAAPIIIGYIYCWINDVSLTAFLFNESKYGYWFTFALFEFFITYYASWLIIKRLGFGNKWGIGILLVSAIFLSYVGNWLGSVMDHNPVVGLLGLNFFNYYIYFIYGVIVHRYFKKVKAITKNGIVMGVCVTLMLLGMVYKSCGDILTVLSPLGFYVYDLILATIALLVVFAAFIRYPQLSTDSVPGRWLTFMGRRTLDIYFLHWFFLPTTLTMVGEWGIEHENTFLIYVASIAVGALVICASLCLGSIIRLSPMLGKLLGAK